MRIWMGDKGLMTFGQLLAYIVHAGSLKEALSHGDITLVWQGDGDCGASQRPVSADAGTDAPLGVGAVTHSKPSDRPRRLLADYLKADADDC